MMQKEAKMKQIIYWNNRPVELDTEDRMILIEENDIKTALLYMPGLPMHVQINLAGPHPVWGWNGSKDKPTFSPSVLTRIPWGTERREIVNHVFIRDGRISYLSDCSHEFAGRSMDLPRLEEWPEDLRFWEE